MTTTHKKAAQARSEYPNPIFEVWPMIIFASRKPGLQMCRVRFVPLDWGMGVRWDSEKMGVNCWQNRNPRQGRPPAERGAS